MDLDKLVRASTLTKAQVDSLGLHRRVLAGEFSLKEAALRRSAGPVTVGAFWRVVKQGRNKVKRSIATMVLASWIGIVRKEELRRLLEITASRDLGTELIDIDHAQDVVLALIDHIVM